MCSCGLRLPLARRQTSDNFCELIRNMRRRTRSLGDSVPASESRLGRPVSPAMAHTVVAPPSAAVPSDFACNASNLNSAGAVLETHVFSTSLYAPRHHPTTPDTSWISIHHLHTFLHTGSGLYNPLQHSQCVSRPHILYNISTTLYNTLQSTALQHFYSLQPLQHPSEGRFEAALDIDGSGGEGSGVVMMMLQSVTGIKNP